MTMICAESLVMGMPLSDLRGLSLGEYVCIRTHWVRLKSGSASEDGDSPAAMDSMDALADLMDAIDD